MYFDFPDNLLGDREFIRLSDDTFIPMVEIGNYDVRTYRNSIAWTYKSIHWFTEDHRLSYSREAILNWLNEKYVKAVSKRQSTISRYGLQNTADLQSFMGFSIWRYRDDKNWFESYQRYFIESFDNAVNIQEACHDPIFGYSRGVKVCFI
jgi:hypothetical protein